MNKWSFLIIAICAFYRPLQAQDEPTITFKDSVDGYLDFSDFLIHHNGFIPVPSLITEPALGGFGFALAPVFMQKNEARIVNGKPQFISPNFTGAVGGYTANNSWFAGGFRVAQMPWGPGRYTIALIYADVNVDFYIKPLNKEIRLPLNMEVLPLFIKYVHPIGETPLKLGAQFIYINNTVSFQETEGLIDLSKLERSNKMRALGLIMELDFFDNDFSPSKGFKTQLTANFGQEWLYSDFNYTNLKLDNFYFSPLLDKFLLGLRLSMNGIIGDIPFYYRPSIQLRGIPIARYQGAGTALIEMENRYDFNLRWSIIGFAGYGIALDAFESNPDLRAAWNVGSGFRYLLARKFKLRMGVDIARGPEDWAYYIIFGNAWNIN